MLRLKNIKINDTVAEADYSPEDSEWWGHIIVDLKSEEILSYDSHPEYRFMHPSHAGTKLVELSKEKDAPKECTVMWY